jgi:predicted TIM-barrel fold metal-dependent hydrolase
MLIVDSQVHIWAANTPERPWAPGAKAHRAEPFGYADLRREMAAAGVDRVVIVPPSLDRTRNDLALDAARLYPDQFAVMGKINPALPESRAALAHWRATPGMLGLRFNFKKNMERLSNPEYMGWVWAEAERAGIPIYVGVDHPAVQLVDAVAERHPRLRLILDHMALASGAKDDEAFRDLDLLLAIAKRPNVAVKVSALPGYTRAPYPYSKLHQYVRRVYDAFGPQRLFWGSDLTRLPCTYHQCVTLFTEEMPWLGTADLELIMGRALCEWIGWPAGQAAGASRAA